MATDPFLSASWFDLVLLNYEIDPDILKPHVPRGTELARFDGRCLVSLVGFRFVDTRLLGWSIPFHRNFDEVNLRFYVQRSTPDGLRKGVVFLKEVVPKTAVALVARWIYNENYVRYPMRRSFHSAPASAVQTFAYCWKFAGRWQTMGLKTAGAFQPPQPGTLNHFLLENYWGYVQDRSGATVEYHVEHKPWQAADAKHSWLDCDTEAFYGKDLGAVLRRDPQSALVVDGSPVTVGWGKKLNDEVQR